MRPITAPSKMSAIGLTLVSFCSVGQEVQIDFGDNSSSYANDGECDDP